MLSLNRKKSSDTEQVSAEKTINLQDARQLLIRKRRGYGVMTYNGYLTQMRSLGFKVQNPEAGSKAMLIQKTANQPELHEITNVAIITTVFRPNTKLFVRHSRGAELKTKYASEGHLSLSLKKVKFNELRKTYFTYSHLGANVFVRGMLPFVLEEYDNKGKKIQVRNLMEDRKPHQLHIDTAQIKFIGATKKEILAKAKGEA